MTDKKNQPAEKTRLSWSWLRMALSLREKIKLGDKQVIFIWAVVVGALGALMALVFEMGVEPVSYTHLYNTTKPYYNLEGMGYQLAEDGTLTLNVGGFNYNGGNAASSPWKTQTFSGYSASTPLTLFYTFNRGTVSISAMLGDNTSTLTTLGDLSSGATFNSVTMTQINFSAKDTSGNTWSAPNGITGKYTLNNFDLYTAVLTEDQMREYALSCLLYTSARRRCCSGRISEACSLPSQRCPFVPPGIPYPCRRGLPT